MSHEDKIAEAIYLLECIELAPKSPAMVVMPPDAGEFIIGNEGGFIHLAIASLRAAQGEEQSFRKQSWATVADYDWVIAGLKPDPNAHIYLPKERSKMHPLWARIFGYVLCLCVAVCLIVGVVTTIRFIFRLH